MTGILHRGGDTAHFNEYPPQEREIVKNTEKNLFMTNSGIVASGKSVVVGMEYFVDHTVRHIKSTDPQTTGLTLDYHTQYKDALLKIDVSLTATYTYVFGIVPTVNNNFLVETNNNKCHKNAFVTLYSGTNETNHLKHHNFTFFYQCDAVDLYRIDIKALSAWDGTGYSLYINNRQNGDMRSFSVLTVTEIIKN